MKDRIVRIAVGVLAGMVILTAVIWLLSHTLGNDFPPLYAGHTVGDWQEQLCRHGVGASNAAFAVINSQVIPRLVDTMFHDTEDSSVRLSLIKMLNDLPGVQISYVEADCRRAYAARYFGDLGPAAKGAIPDLINALKGKDAAIRGPAISSLGGIHSEPETVIPLLIPCLDDDNLDVPAAKALAEYGSLAKSAVPKLLPLLHGKDNDDRLAARAALLRIDPDAAAKAGVK